MAKVAKRQVKLSEVPVGSKIEIGGFKYVHKGSDKRKTQFGRQEHFIFWSEEAKQEKYTNDGKTAIIQQTVASDSTKSSKLFGAAIEEMASFPGGSAALMQYIAQNLRYPNIQGDCNIQGRVIVGFTVNEDGTLSDIKVMKSISPTFDEEAILVVKSMPKWNPAKQNGKAVKTKYTVPVTFRLE